MNKTILITLLIALIVLSACSERPNLTGKRLCMNGTTEPVNISGELKPLNINFCYEITSEDNDLVYYFIGELSKQIALQYVPDVEIEEPTMELTTENDWIGVIEKETEDEIIEALQVTYMPELNESKKPVGDGSILITVYNESFSSNETINLTGQVIDDITPENLYEELIVNLTEGLSTTNETVNETEEENNGTSNNNN